MPNSFSDRMYGPAKQMAKKGRFGDSILAHINPKEAALLKARGGSGTINPMTGALEFVNEEDFDADFYLAQNRDVELSGGDAWEHYNTFVNNGNETRAGNIQEQQAQDFGSFTGTFDQDFYSANNQDVVDAIAGGTYDGSLKDHFYSHGRQEGRTFNQAQQDLKDAGTDIERFGSNQFGGLSDRATQRINTLGARSGVSLDRGSDTNKRDVLNDDGTNLRSNLIGEGDFAIDLLGGTSDMLNTDLFSQVGSRDLAMDAGYLGNFDPDTIDVFNENYFAYPDVGNSTSFGTDQDPSTFFTAANDSNINRAGLDVGPQRDIVRDLGYEGRFGGDGAGDFVGGKLSEFGLSSTGNIQNDATLINNAQATRTLQTQLETQLAALEEQIAAAELAAQGGDGLGDTGSTTSNLTTAPSSDPVASEPSTDVSTGNVVSTPTMPFATPNVQSQAMTQFRPTQINPFTGALEYVPFQQRPSAFSQTVLNPRYSGGFGTNIRL